MEFRKVLSEYVLPEALQMGVGRQRDSWVASMSRHALPHALPCSLPRQRSARQPLSLVRPPLACLDSVLRDTSSERFEYTYAILYCFSFDKVL